MLRHVSSYFEKLRITPVTVFLEFNTFEIIIKTHSKEEILTLLPEHGYNTRTKSLKKFKLPTKEVGGPQVPVG